MTRRARSVCMPELALKSVVPARTQHYADSVVQPVPGSQDRGIDRRGDQRPVRHLPVGARRPGLVGGAAQPRLRRDLRGGSAAVPVRRADRTADVLRVRVCVGRIHLLHDRDRIGPAVLLPRIGDARGARVRDRAHRAGVDDRRVRRGRHHRPRTASCPTTEASARRGCSPSASSAPSSDPRSW